MKSTKLVIWTTLASCGLLSMFMFGQTPARNKGDINIGLEASSNDSMESRMGPRSQKRPMTLALAKRIVAAASEVACQYPKNAPQCLGTQVVADDAGAIIYLETLDGTQVPSIEGAIQKARTSALWHRPTQQFHDAVTNGSNMSYLDGTFQNLTTAPGGVPLSVNGTMVGGFGTSGNPFLAPIIEAAQEELKKIAAEGLIK
jgi:uncharacterized protein GlcG (DUF336 family)